MYVLLFAALAFWRPVSAQLNTNSPYSIFGLGNLRSNSFVMNTAMGGSGYGMTSPYHINNLNPASYSFLKLTAFEAAAEQNNEWLKSSDQSEYNPHGGLRYVAFGFPVAKYWGLSFGIMPYSNVGYYFQKTDSTANLGRVDNTYQGSGGLNKVYIGNGFKVKIDSSFFIAGGVNANYMFGEIYHEQRILFRNLTNVFHTWYYDKTFVSDFAFDVGLQVKKKFCTRRSSEGNCEDTGFELGLGVVYGLQANLSSKLTRLGRTYTGNVGFESIKDTSVNILDSAVQTAIPQTLGVGLTLGNIDKFMVNVDYQLQSWGDINASDTALSNSMRLSAGIQYIPDIEKVNNYLQRVRYRMGVRYQQSYLTLNNSQIEDFGITFGVGLPFHRTSSTMNFGVVVGQKGTTNNELFKQQYVNFSVGITLNDLWFYKRKYD